MLYQDIAICLLKQNITIFKTKMWPLIYFLTYKEKLNTRVYAEMLGHS